MRALLIRGVMALLREGRAVEGSGFGAWFESAVMWTRSAPVTSKGGGTRGAKCRQERATRTDPLLLLIGISAETEKIHVLRNFIR
jgi:hypothetical protein